MARAIEFGSDGLSGGLEVAAFHRRGCSREGELPNIHRGNDVDMHVRHFIASDDHPHLVAVERCLLRTTNMASDGEEMIAEVVGKIDPVVGFHPRDNKGMTRRHRVDGHEGNTAVIAPDECARYVAIDDASKDRGHLLSVGSAG